MEREFGLFGCMLFAAAPAELLAALVAVLFLLVPFLATPDIIYTFVYNTVYCNYNTTYNISLAQSTVRPVRLASSEYTLSAILPGYHVCT